MLEIIINIYIVAAIGFAINLVPFCFWAARKKPTSEFLLYQVRGRFSYFNVLVWLDEMEKVLPNKLTEERKWIRTWMNRSKKGNKPFYRYKHNVKEVLYMKYFGKKPRATAFFRMASYSKVVYIWHMVLSLTIINCVMLYFVHETNLGWQKSILPILFGGGALFLVVFTFLRFVLNFTLLIVAKILIFIKGDAGYFHELIYQFEGVYDGHFINIGWDDTPKSKISGLDTSAESLAYIKNTYFKGGASSGSW